MGTPIHAIAPSHEPRPSPPFSNTSIRSFGVTGSLRFGAPRILFKPLRNIDRRGGIKRTFIYLEAAAFLCVMRPIAGPPNGRCLAGCCHSAVRSRNQKRTAPSQSGQYTWNARWPLACIRHCSGLHDGGVRSVRSSLRRPPLLATPIATPLQGGRPERRGLFVS